MGYNYQVPNYEVPSGLALMFGHYDLQAGIYYINAISADNAGVFTSREQKPANFWTPQGLAAGGVR